MNEFSQLETAVSSGDLNKKTVAELKNIARTLKVKGFSKFKKAELVCAITDKGSTVHIEEPFLDGDFVILRRVKLPELKLIAKAEGIVQYNKLKKSELIRAIIDGGAE